ncbi:MAG: FliM/FliN family flagellar motor C-terminal domain-containing protein [Acidobacteriota bacterium]|nr:FliM/FliN family flagellar motor C-terminal domain-containing protein [Acidobacteriota bacterium]MDQ7088967.1 FliM/FliN family flagellar motor C-terminal domain-containing protein [Acidobacteriota bacterium]
MNDETKHDATSEEGSTRVVDPNPGSETASLEGEAYRLGEIAKISMLDRLELPIEVRLGRLNWELEKVLQVRVGDAVPIGPDGDDVVTLYVQDRPYAVGDLVVVDGRFAFRVRELVSDSMLEVV